MTADEAVTIVVMPRDRFSSVTACVQSILDNTAEPFRLMIVDLGYSAHTRRALEAMCAAVPFELVACPRTIPMNAFQQCVERIATPYTCWVDNDTFVTAGWLTALLQSATTEGRRVLSPLTFEREGLDIDDRRLTLRVHISHAELRKVTVDGTEYVFDYKPFRRAAKEDLPATPWLIDFFELHTFFAETAVLRQLEYPAMVVREHVDIGIQLHRLGIPIWCEPRSEVVFDNIHTRPTIEDLRFFFFRWSDRRVDRSQALFAERWGWHFYNEQHIRNWAFRRRVFSLARFCYLPHKAADMLSRAMVKFFRPGIPAALRPDPVPSSVRVFDTPVGEPAAS
jgi:hypothetical protein